MTFQYLHEYCMYFLATSMKKNKEELVVSFNVDTALIGAFPVAPGGTDFQAYYDVADLTWMADANAAGTEMIWVDTNNWAAGLTVGGINGWRRLIRIPVMISVLATKWTICANANLFSGDWKVTGDDLDTLDTEMTLIWEKGINEKRSDIN